MYFGKMHEISRKVININKYEGTDLTWHNSVLTVRGNKDLHLLEFMYDVQSLEKKIEFKESTVSCIKYNKVIGNHLVKYVSNGVENSELVEMVTNPAFWPHNNLLMEEMTKIVAYQWSPCDLISNNDSVLAVINSVGNIEFFGPKRYGWKCIFNFSVEMSKILNLNFDKFKGHPKNFQQIKQVVYSIESVTLCWAPELNDDNSCYLATAQKSGQILFWSIKYCDGNFEVEFCGSIQNLNDIDIITLKWIPRQHTKFLLISSNEHGQVVAYECKIKNNSISQMKEYILWNHKDKMIITHLNYLEQDKLLLLFNKHRHLVVQMYDKNLKLLSQHVQVVNDYKITCICSNKNYFYVTTFNSKIYKVDYSMMNDNLEVSLKEVETKDMYQNHELFGMAVSTNGAIVALALIARHLLHRKESLKIEIILLSFDAGYDTDVSNILNNPTKNIAHIWDCVEVLRCKVIKAKKLPEIDYNTLLKDGDTDMYKLKVYLIFLKFYYNLDKHMTPGLKGLMPETSIDVIKDRILVRQAVSQICNIHDCFQSNGTLSSFEWESFIFSKKYLNHYCKKYKKCPTDFVSDNILVTDVAYNSKVKYVCQSCDEELIEFLCKSNHFNLFCSLTFTPIEDDYLVCKSCDALSRTELFEEKPSCVYCDLYLSNSILPT